MHNSRVVTGSNLLIVKPIMTLLTKQKLPRSTHPQTATLNRTEDLSFPRALPELTLLQCSWLVLSQLSVLADSYQPHANLT